AAIELEMAAVAGKIPNAESGFTAILSNSIAPPFDGQAMGNGIEFIPECGVLRQRYMLLKRRESAIYCYQTANVERLIPAGNVKAKHQLVLVLSRPESGETNVGV